MSALPNRRMTVVILDESRRPLVFVVGGEPTPPATLRPGEHYLPCGEVARIPRTGQRLRVVSGYAWITFDGLDFTLLPGEAMALPPGDDPAVVSALEGQPLVYRLVDPIT